MPPHTPGLYETLLIESLAAELQGLADGLREHREPLRPAEAADRLSLHVARIVKRLVAAVDERHRVALGVKLTRHLVTHLRNISDTRLPGTTGAVTPADRPTQPGEILQAIQRVLPDGSSVAIRPPLIPLLDTAILTNAPGEPTVGSQLLAEIHSADAIDLVMAFIRYTGIAPMLDTLIEHLQTGRPLRVLTTTYTGSTEARALDALEKAGAEIRVSYDTSTTRLHAKSWLFHRHSGFSTAYIGSSNLTHSAQVTGLEWNVRVSGARNPDVVEKVTAVFNSYWNSGTFQPYEREQFLEQTEPSNSGPAFMLSPVEIRLEPFQEDLLAKIALARSQGHHRNLLAAATGTGKTVMAAVDYSRLAEHLPRARLLFVAHREEILTQALGTFRHALREPAFGELWVGRQKPQRFEHVFASIQSLTAVGFEHLQPDHFDVVIVDEFHHAAATSYTRLLEHVQPVELLGLTATPERSDGLPVLSWFDERIAAELRLWDAIDQQRLTPFSYYGIHDTTDLRDVPWRRGTGYDVERLTDVLTVNDAYARVVLQELARRTGDPTQVRALGFCVSVRHARFMARVFNEAGIKATAVWADTPDAERRAALRDLKHGTVNVLFSVDLFNEGVDVPVVDTLLFLRPTDSPTLFLQQLGRGNLSWTELRQAAGLATATAGPADDHLLRACGRLLHIDDQRRIAAYREVFNLPPLTHFESLSPTTRTFVQMLVASLAGGAVSKNDRISAGLHLLQSHGRVRDEMLAVLDVLESRISHATLPLATHPGVPLEVHARYSRLEILAAFGLRETAKMPPWQTGVYWARSARADLLAFTLDKTSGGFSPTTRYRDYALGRDRAASSR